MIVEKKYVIVRTNGNNVFAGYLESKNGQEVVLTKARNLKYWSGAASLSQLAMEGVKNPNECQFTCEVDKVELLNCIEIIDVSEKAKKNIIEIFICKDFSNLEKIQHNKKIKNESKILLYTVSLIFILCSINCLINFFK